MALHFKYTCFKLGFRVKQNNRRLNKGLYLANKSRVCLRVGAVCLGASYGCLPPVAGAPRGQRPGTDRSLHLGGVLLELRVGDRCWWPIRELYKEVSVTDRFHLSFLPSFCCYSA